MAHDTHTTCPDLGAFIVSKYDPLLTIVKELNENLQHLERENLRLERRIVNLEQYIAGAQAADVVYTLEEESALSPPWLFSCQYTHRTDWHRNLNVASTLGVQSIKHDGIGCLAENMWIAFMEEIPAMCNIKVDLKEMVDLQSMRRIARRVLMELSQNEAMVVLRNVPGKDEATTNATTITLVAILASAIAEAWKRVEYTTPQNMGRVCLILEGRRKCRQTHKAGENIGSRLRAGTKKFRIEPLN
ncbi:hypothetical protein, conserved [Babesia bigemina]|uniref:Uncharacterized protein n=1 Tax=Babesia bigemina TaxID=5866 RepID=A0A061D726_BABBI|nr:hypothetical protein, conserved [Babesia bigemina]CDR96313.1 hypothetical protein, conserved [Babesia bigemina]|eukprot:XP_012768499.1 hypothetical protein, conserved [Babesia bigemina]